MSYLSTNHKTMDTQSIINRAYSPDNTRAIGSIVKDEAYFLCQMVSKLKPDTVVEIGVASGRSSVVLGLCLASGVIPPFCTDGFSRS